jgi:hypothetical protein
MGEPRTYDVARFVGAEIGKLEGQAFFGSPVSEIVSEPGRSDLTVLFEDGTAFEISVRRSIDNANGTARDEDLDAAENAR